MWCRKQRLWLYLTGYNLRRLLSEMVVNQRLSATQTIDARHIITELNRQTVTAMVTLLELNNTNTTPEALIGEIRYVHIQFCWVFFLMRLPTLTRCQGYSILVYCQSFGSDIFNAVNRGQLLK